MLRYLPAAMLCHHPRLARSMFVDRAWQFSRRLGWEAVRVDANGEERDAYDAQAPIYVIWQGEDGRHGGSMRFLPTTGPTMLNEHFRQLTGGRCIESPLIWECSRFCLSPGAPARVSAALMLGGLELGLALGLTAAVGVFDARMERIYARVGWPPRLIGTAGEGRARIGAGLWHFDPGLRPRLLARAQISAEQSRAWLLRDLSPVPRPAHAAAGLACP